MTFKPGDIAFPSNSYMGWRDFLAFAGMAEDKVLASGKCGTEPEGQAGNWKELSTSCAGCRAYIS